MFCVLIKRRFSLNCVSFPKVNSRQIKNSFENVMNVWVSNQQVRRLFNNDKQKMLFYQIFTLIVRMFVLSNIRRGRLAQTRSIFQKNVINKTAVTLIPQLSLHDWTILIDLSSFSKPSTNNYGFLCKQIRKLSCLTSRENVL